ncbi:hypothetical protein [Actinacidiphila sp. bgisy144]|jgi:hypothetical protein|uniref:hypothetical protein n=1 Tax=Actinacidiphila sp. bgisy144 TaxID=3413791 RepID=UPI003EBE0764
MSVRTTEDHRHPFAPLADAPGGRAGRFGTEGAGQLGGSPAGAGLIARMQALNRRCR